MGEPRQHKIGQARTGYVCHENKKVHTADWAHRCVAYRQSGAHEIIIDNIFSKMPHTYRVVKVKTGYKIKSKTKTLKRTFKSKQTAESTIRNLYKLAKGKHKKY
mgnify:CR=1 FL=1